MSLLQVGKIVNTHGIRGEVRVQSNTNHAEDRYQTGRKLVAVFPNQSEKELTVTGHRVHKSFDLVSFEEIPSINEGELLVGAILCIDSEDLPETDEDEHYVHELIDMDVQTEEGEIVGRLKEVLEYPANDVWVVERPHKKDLLLPAIREVILSVDYENRRIQIHLMKGLDEEDEN